MRIRLARVLLVCAAGVSLSSTVAVTQQPPVDGPAPVHADWHALVGATVITAPGAELENGTIVVRGERIVSVAAGAAPPAGANVIDAQGLTIYPAFIDAHVGVDVDTSRDRSVVEHWNTNVRPGRDGAVHGDFDDDDAAKLRTLGFGVAALAPNDGVFRGTGSVVALDAPRTGETRAILRSQTYHSIGLRRRSGGDPYPRSLMGAIALIRQTLIDATRSDSVGLAALRHDAPLLFDTVDELDALRTAKIATECGRPALLLGSGLEFRRLDAISERGLAVILPLAFPQAPAVATLDDRARTTLRAMQTWEQAPTNPRRLLDAGVTIALTTDKIEDRSDFDVRLRRAMRYGLSHDQALASLTTTPAKLLGLEGQVGTIAPGSLANLLVIDGRLGGEESERRSIWIRGREHVLERAPAVVTEGRWSTALEVGGVRVDEIRIADGAATLIAGEAKTKAASYRHRGRQIDLTFDAKKLGGDDGVVSVNALVDPRRMLGTARDARGRRVGWTAAYAGKIEKEAPDQGESATDDEAADDLAKEESETREAERRIAVLNTRLAAPLGAYGLPSAPNGGDVIVSGATIWTSAAAGIIEDGTLVLRDGKIDWVGPTSEAPALGDDVTRIDGTGLHLTPGLIDCHSHTGISRGVNEGTQAVTAEVRIEDVLNPDDIGWYRELAGGLTCVNQLHGSANPIGGQNNVVKLRWGVREPDAMRLEGAPGGIKFALGENVKQSRSPRSATSRYPQTRMGVEALIRERFTAARHYVAARATDPSTRPRDLELDALAEILAGDRLVHCHSYRQDEILMLCRVAGEFGFQIGTFQHGLECYKVAEAVRTASRGASIFTDWWAYKFEVIDAIPENGAILHETGVVTSFNSDSNELARRMNVEAAKAVKYGGVARADALKFVTLHPAMQLGIDARVGSLEKGKDADFALWTGDPLSSMTRCVSTWIDGRCYWSHADDQKARIDVDRERQRLIQVLLTVDNDEREGEDGPGWAFTASVTDNLPGDCGCCEEFTTENQR